MEESNLVPISKGLVLVNSISGIATRVLTVGVFAWVIQYLMKRIPEEELALLPIVMSIALALPLLQSVLTGGLSRFVTEAYARNDLPGVTRIVSSQFPLLVTGGMLLIVVGGAIVWNIHHLLTIPPSMIGEMRFMLLLVLGRLSLGMVLAPFNTGLFANQRFVLQNCIDIGSSVLRIVLTLVLILGVGPRVQWVITAHVASQLFGLLTSTIISMRLLPALRFHAASFDWETSKRVLSFGGWNFVVNSANVIRRAADAPILNVLATPVAVNDFFLGSLFETQLRQMAIAASEPLMPAFTAMHARDQTARLASAYIRGGRIALWASMFLAAPLIVFSYDLFALYLGDSYAEHVSAATVMIILLLGFPLTYPSLMLARICFARGNIRSLAIAVFAAQMANLALTLLLVGPFQLGAVGSAAATLAAFVGLHPFFMWPLAIRTLDLSWRRFVTQTLFSGLFPAVVAMCVAWFSAQFFATHLSRVLVGVPTCVIVYIIMWVIALRPVDRADLARIRDRVWA